jgi:TPR repeat protein
MIASILILFFSLILFVYWFRYTCLLVLSAKSVKDYTSQVATANRLSFVAIQERIAATDATEHLDSLQKALDGDYRMLTCLMRHAAGFDLGGCDLEHRMLMVDFALMRSWYAVTRKLAIPQAQSALAEMAEIIGHFANTMGERGDATAGI